MEMEDTTELNLLEEGTQKISAFDDINGYNYTAEKSDSFVIDMKGFHSGSTVSKDPILSPSPRIALQRSLSRNPSSQRAKNNPPDGDSLVPSPGGPSTPETDTAARTTYPSTNQQVHHQITITTSNTNSTSEGRCTVRRNSFKRYPPTWVLHPKRVHFFFAILSSMGTLLLIYFTLSMGRIITHENALD